MPYPKKKNEKKNFILSRHVKFEEIIELITLVKLEKKMIWKKKKKNESKSNENNNIMTPRNTSKTHRQNKNRKNNEDGKHVIKLCDHYIT